MGYRERSRSPQAATRTTAIRSSRLDMPGRGASAEQLQLRDGLKGHAVMPSGTHPIQRLAMIVRGVAGIGFPAIPWVTERQATHQLVADGLGHAGRGGDRGTMGV